MKTKFTWNSKTKTLYYGKEVIATEVGTLISANWEARIYATCTGVPFSAIRTASN
jgi:hypothetical protein